MIEYLQHQNDFTNPKIVSVLEELSFWSSHFGVLLFKHIKIRKNINILDVGCGLGFPLFELAHVYGGSCQLTGIDIWKEALVRAHEKLEVYGLTNVRIIESEETQIPLPDSHFDLIVSNLGVNNFAHPQAMMSECYRVAKPNAEIVITTNINGHMKEFYKTFRETLIEFDKKDYLSYLDTNENHRGTKESICKLLEEAGFKVARVIEDEFYMRYADGSSLLNHFLTRVGFLDGWKKVVAPVDQAEVFSLLEDKLNKAARVSGELVMTVPMLYVEGNAIKD